METGTAPKRPRGRPRRDAAPMPEFHVRLPPEIKAQLEHDAKRAKRSVTKEFVVRVRKSYLSDQIYGGSQMATMFRELAEVAEGVANQQNSGSFFDDFEAFVLVTNIWDIIIQSHMPRPSDELLAKVSRAWNGSKAASPQTTTEAAARDWLIRHAPLPHGVTLASLLAGAFTPATSKSDEKHEPTSDPAAVAPKLPASEMSIPPIGGLGQVIEGLIQCDSNAEITVMAIGGVAKIMADLIRSQGSARAAAGEVSRLAQLLAEATEDSPAGDNAAPPIAPGTDDAAVPR